MLRQLRSELHRLVRRWMPWVMLGIIAITGALFYVLVYVSVNAQREAIREGRIPQQQAGGEAAMNEALEMLRPEHIHQFGVPAVVGIGSVMLIVFAASHVGTEFGWGTLRTLLAHGSGRASFLVSKYVSLLLYAVVFMAVGAAAVTASALVLSAATGTGGGPVDAGGIVSVAAKGTYTFLPYMALGALIAVLARSSGAGIATGLVIYFAESLVAGILVSLNRDYATIVNYGIARNVSAVNRTTVVSTGAGPEQSFSTLPDAGQAAIVLAVYTLVFMALAFWRLRTRDVTLA